MKLKISPDLSSLKMYAIGDEISRIATASVKKELFVGELKDPVLLTDIVEIVKLPSVQRDAILKLFEFPDKTVEYDGVDVHWSPVLYPNVWGPSIDTMLFAKAIREQLVDTKLLKQVNDFLEIGTGSGFLSKYILQKRKELGGKIEIAHLTDINKDAIKCAMDNIEPVRDGTLIYYTHTQPNAHLRVEHKYDLVIANPPYIPRPNARKNNPYEGLLLYEEIIRNASKMLHSESVFITMLSSLSKAFIKPALDDIFQLHIAARLRVPLKIPIITAGLSLQSKKWISYLKAQKLIEEDKSERSGYRYWQTIEVVIGKLK